MASASGVLARCCRRSRIGLGIDIPLLRLLEADGNPAAPSVERKAHHKHRRRLPQVERPCRARPETTELQIRFRFSVLLTQTARIVDDGLPLGGNLTKRQIRRRVASRAGALNSTPCRGLPTRLVNHGLSGDLWQPDRPAACYDVLLAVPINLGTVSNIRASDA